MADMSDLRKAITLDEACSNGDGTYNGARALSWLSDVLSGGKGVPVADVERTWLDAKRKANARQRAAPVAP
jgi:hypothetical protein